MDVHVRHPTSLWVACGVLQVTELYTQQMRSITVSLPRRTQRPESAASTTGFMIVTPRFPRVKGPARKERPAFRARAAGLSG
jgi:hypothetical protein